jgi:hypothetical protein
MFNPARGIRQRCPLSANLFVLIVEILACAIRQNPRINGIKIGHAEFKISQYADDTCVYVANIDSLRLIFHVLELFTKVSGLKVNRDKSEAIGIGNSSNFKHHDIGIKWPNGSIRCLGIFINPNMDSMIKDNFNPCLEKIENILELWCLRKLTLKGKILVINTLIVSQLIYICTVLNTPKWVLDRYNEMIRKFIWDGKPAKVKYRCLINNLEDGGLKLQDMGAKIKAIKIKWYKNMIKDDFTAPWKAYVNTFCKENIKNILSYNSSVNDLPDFKDEFYREILTTWVEIHFQEPKTSEDVCRQQICHNAFI